LPKEKSSILDWATLKTQVKEGQFTSVTSDSRLVKSGTLFVAVSGLSQDGHDFIEQAVKQGAKAVVGERNFSLSVPYWAVKDSRASLAELATAFYHDPSSSLKMAAITGTSGKTTVTYLVEGILQEAGFKVGVIGTVNFRFGKKIYPSTHTTPDPVELQRLLREMKNEGVTHVVMEVSSHALKQHRVAGISFDAMGFTNLSPEHLDFHPDIEDYFQSKAMLFREFFDQAEASGKKPVRVINADDRYGQRLLGELPSSTPYGLGLASLKDSLSGISGTFGDLKIRSPLTGRFNISNLLCAIEMSRALGATSEAIEKSAARLTGAPGRLEKILNSKGIHAFVDYAHKSDALEKVLKTLHAMRSSPQRLITVFGCGGDRDKLKRPVMGKIAAEFSDEVIVTWDNPRTEDPQAIMTAIVEGIEAFDPEKSYRVEPDRKKAIELAVSLARSGDFILVAGKGHEDYQIIGTKKTHFDDREVLSHALNQTGPITGGS
jgi:UDP-N-acetylmuramoyl-L-alanyl-D-glutamate--2,6-diaminopimelate ligase